MFELGTQINFFFISWRKNLLERDGSHSVCPDTTQTTTVLLIPIPKVGCDIADSRVTRGLPIP